MPNRYAVKREMVYVCDVQTSCRHCPRNGERVWLSSVPLVDDREGDSAILVSPNTGLVICQELLREAAIR